MMITMSEALGKAEVGPRVVHKLFYGGLAGIAVAVWWLGFSVTAIVCGAVGGAAAGTVVGIALVLFDAFAKVMVSRRKIAQI